MVRPAAPNELRIPDIYESMENQRAFGRFLDTCACFQNEAQILAAIRRLDAHAIKGLGPAAEAIVRFGSGMKSILTVSEALR